MGLCIYVMANSAKHLRSVPRSRFALLVRDYLLSVAMTIASAGDNLGEERFSLCRGFGPSLCGMQN